MSGSTGTVINEQLKREGAPTLIAEYQIPYIGTVRFFDHTSACLENQLYHGPYSSLSFKDIKNLRELVDSDTEEGLYRETNKAIAQILLARRKELTDELAQIQGIDEGVISGSFSENWMEKYKQNQPGDKK